MSTTIYIGVDDEKEAFASFSFAGCLDYLHNLAGGELVSSEITDYETLPGNAKLAKSWTIYWRDSNGEEYKVYLEKTKVYECGDSITGSGGIYR